MPSAYEEHVSAAVVVDVVAVAVAVVVVVAVVVTVHAEISAADIQPLAIFVETQAATEAAEYCRQSSYARVPTLAKQYTILLYAR